MFVKYTFFTIAITLAVTVYLHQYHPSSVSYLQSFISYTPCSSGNTVESDSKQPTDQDLKLYTADDLRKYNGEEGSNGLYLAILGNVYDVEKGIKHYGPGGSYHFFTGRDGSRAFVTGDFTEEGLTDDIIGLTPKEIKSIQQWGNFYKKDYTYKGKVVGRYFDADGKKTAYHINIDKLIESANIDEENEKTGKLAYPPCNVEWSQENGSRVWCTKLSGGIERDWVGVPRQLYEPGTSSFRCACIQDSQHPNEGDSNLAKLKEYPDCHPEASSCNVLT